jgi:ribosomal protein S27E
VNTIRIGIADGGDNVYDSNLLIAGDSIQTALIAGDDAVSLTAGTPADVDVLANDATSSGGTLTITHINGQPVVVGDTIKLPTGEQITLTEKGFAVLSNATEEGTNTFSYTVEDSAGNTDTAFVDVTTSVPCFVAGTMIATPQGLRPVERIAPGELVDTLDHGPQPVRWVGLRRLDAADLAAAPALRPVRIAAGALGDGLPLTDLFVSPQHRVLVCSRIALRLFDGAGVLVAAKQLLGMPGIVMDHGAKAVTYVHLLFDRHEVVLSNGAATESLYIGPEMLKSLDAAARDEVLTLFPALLGQATARRLVPGKNARNLAFRHTRNNVGLQAALVAQDARGKGGRMGLG